MTTRVLTAARSPITSGSISASRNRLSLAYSLGAARCVRSPETTTKSKRWPATAGRARPHSWFSSLPSCVTCRSERWRIFTPVAPVHRPYAAQSIVGIGRPLLLQRLHRRDDLLQLANAAVVHAEAMLVQGHRILRLLRRTHKVSLLLLSPASKGARDPLLRKSER